jgi:hypothetical protein
MPAWSTMPGLSSSRHLTAFIMPSFVSSIGWYIQIGSATWMLIGIPSSPLRSRSGASRASSKCSPFALPNCIPSPLSPSSPIPARPS